MKILITADTYYPHVNGCSYFTQRLAYNLARFGHEVRVLAPSMSLENTDETKNGVRVCGVRSFPILFYHEFRFCVVLWKNSFIESVIDDFKPDIVHLQGHFAISRYAMKYAQRKNIPVVATNHFMPENIIHYVPFNSLIGPTVMRLAWKDFAGVFGKVRQITTPTRIASKLIQPYFKHTIHPISCGIDLDIFKPNNNGDYLKEKYHLTDKPILLYVGRLDREKNIDLVIRAVAKALKKASFQYVIAGTGAERNNLEGIMSDLGIGDSVRLLGFVKNEDLPNLYAIAKCFAIAGHAELQSIVTMEAMATGLPVLALNAVALPELVRDGQNGFLFEADNSDLLAEKIVTIFTDENLRKDMGKKSLEFIQEHGIRNTISKFENLYRGEINIK